MKQYITDMYSTISKCKRAALNRLSNDKDIIIVKPADKGGVTVRHK